VELVPYNLAQYSQTFTNGVWGVAGYGNPATIVANDTIAPDGTMTASKATFTAAGTQGRLVQSITTTNGAEYTASFYVKYGNKTTINFYSDAAVFGTFVTFNFTSNTITNSNNTYGSSVENVGNGWYRISFKTFAPSSTAQFGFITFGGEDGFCYIWGGQLESGATATAYQKTETRLNIPRLDYSNGTCPSLLVEPQRTNLLTWSQDLTQWNQISEIASRQLVANPLTGVNNATKITKTSGGGDPYVGQIQSAVNGTYSYSVYLWTDSGQPLDLTLFMYNDSVSEVYTFNVTLTTTPTRFDYAATFSNTGGTITTRIDLTGASANQYIYAYGAQLEVGSYSTSYIPTTSASVTRNADVISKTGISSLIGQTEGTIFVDAEVKDINRGQAIMFVNGTSGNNFIIYKQIDNILKIFVQNGGSTLVNIGTTNYTSRVKVAVAYALNDVAVYVNGVLYGTDTSVTIPACTRVSLGCDDISGQVMNGDINAAALWKTRLTNDQLATLTTL
jgi:hypothetical protein